MDLERIVALINTARKMLGKPEITVEQYNEILQGSSWNTELYRASAEAARADFAKLRMSHDKYPDIPGGHPLARCYYFFLREEKSKDDEEFNRNFMARLKTWEGTKEIVKDIFRQVAELPAEVYFPASEMEVIENFKKYNALFETVFNATQLMASLREWKMDLDPSVKQFIESHHSAFEILAKQGKLVRLWGSPFYPVLGDEDFTTIMVAANSVGKEKTVEQEAFNLFGQNSTAYVSLEAEEDYFKAGRILLNNGQLRNLKYITENVEEIVSGATENTVIPEPDPEIKKALDDSLAGDFIMHADLRVAPRAKELLDNGLINPENNIKLSVGDEKLVKLFGQKFVFDEKNLENGVYTPENFHVSNYELPENCPFTEAEASLIGLASFSLKGIGDASRHEIPELQRISGNYNFVVENMISGKPRRGVGPVLNQSVDLARKNIVPLIQSYMEGNKQPLADALVSAIKVEAGSVIMSDLVQKNTCYSGKLLNSYIGILQKDPELMALARESGKLNENELNTAKLSGKFTSLYQEREAALNEFYADICSGRIPSEELKKKLAVKTVTLDLISKMKNREQNSYCDSVHGKGKTGLLEAELKSNKKDPAAALNYGAKMNILLMEAPLSDFMLRLKDPGKLEEFEKLVEGTALVRKMTKMAGDKLVEALKYNSNIENLDGSISAEALNELKDSHALEDFTGAYPVSQGYLRYDVESLEFLQADAARAQQDVHLGSSQYDVVENGIKLILEANKKLERNPDRFTAENVLAMKHCYSVLAKDCNAYLTRKEKQGKLDVDPRSKTGKRIALVRKVLKFSEEHSAKFASAEAVLKARDIEKSERSQAEKLLYDVLTKETAGPLLKHLNGLAAENNDPVRGAKIVNQMNLVGKYMKENNLSAEECGLDEKDLQKAMENIERGGLMKAPQAKPEKTAAKEEIPVI